MNELKEIIALMLNEIDKKENILNVKGARGGGYGTAYPDKTVGVLRMLGHEEQDEKQEYELKPVKISKIFARRKNVK